LEREKIRELERKNTELTIAKESLQVAKVKLEAEVTAIMIPSTKLNEE
jgi:hypothetical protein